MTQITAEQQAIIVHDPQKHATVLAVAGSGKTTTMIHRIRWLIQAQGVPARLIRAVMYNASAKNDFDQKLKQIGLPEVAVQTFHAMGASILQWAAQNGFTTPRKLIDPSEHKYIIKGIISEITKSKNIKDVIHPEDAIDAISTWKAMLTPPEKAHHLEKDYYKSIYAAFEKHRKKENIITFDDQIYDAVRLIESTPKVEERLANKLEHLIIDEFQDVNYARMRLSHLLAGHRARVMVVGDDDQCIYEWQGARSSYIKRGFQLTFPTFPHATYKLSRSFRFGPAVAQLASNVIGHNSDRVEKDLVASDMLMGGDACFHAEGNKHAIPVIRNLLQGGALPVDIVILIRKYSQSFQIQYHMLLHKIPFYVEGNPTLHELPPIKIALAYIDVSCNLHAAVTEHTMEQLAFIINKPSRFVRIAQVKMTCQSAIHQGMTLYDAFSDDIELLKNGYTKGESTHIKNLIRRLEELTQTLKAADAWDASGLLESLVSEINFRKIFEEYEQPHAIEDDLTLVSTLQNLLKDAGIEPHHAYDYVTGLDPRQGRENRDCIKITTVFKAKGLEWDHVLLPDLIDGQIPDLRQSINVCTNTHDPDRTMEATTNIESERRLFYVALTRARRSVHLFADPTSKRPVSRFVHESFLHATVDAITNLQCLLRRQLPDAVTVPNIVQSGAKDAHLREGMLKMIRRLSEGTDDPAVVGPLTALLYRLNSVPPAPFSYPHAYHTPTKPIKQPDDDGLPF